MGGWETVGHVSAVLGIGAAAAGGSYAAWRNKQAISGLWKKLTGKTPSPSEQTALDAAIADPRGVEVLGLAERGLNQTGRGSEATALQNATGVGPSS